MLYYIPIYFQAVRNTSAANSGIRNLSLIITDSMFSFQHSLITLSKCIRLTTYPALLVIASGLGITVLGYFAPFAIIGSVIATVGCGMIYTWTTESSSAVWIGYQALAGIGVGLCFQVPIMAGQALAEPEDVSSTTGLLLCKSNPPSTPLYDERSQFITPHTLQ